MKVLDINETIEAITSISIGKVELWRIVTIFLIILIAFAIGKMISFFLTNTAKRSEKSNKKIQAAFLTAIAKSSTFIIISLGLYIAINLITKNPQVREILTTINEILIVISIGYLLYLLVEIPSIWFESQLEKTDNAINKMFIPVIRKSLRITIILLVIIQVIQILSDKPITSVIAGLGIGGLAVALAAQDSLKHFFGSLILMTDKPFQIGDRIVVDGFDGPVEEVGLRSTRIRTLEGHLITIPNGELANRLIQNIGKRPYIRRLANITITYDTPLKKIYRAVEIIKEILDNHEGMNPDFPPRVYFNDLNSDSLNIIMIYWYHPPDYWAYMEFNEKVNYELMKRFGEEGIEFAFPTQTLYLAGDDNRPLNIGLNKNKEETE